MHSSHTRVVGPRLFWMSVDVRLRCVTLQHHVRLHESGHWPLLTDETRRVNDRSTVQYLKQSLSKESFMTGKFKYLGCTCVLPLLFFCKIPSTLVGSGNFGTLYIKETMYANVSSGEFRILLQFWAVEHVNKSMCSLDHNFFCNGVPCVTLKIYVYVFPRYRYD